MEDDAAFSISAQILQAIANALQAPPPRTPNERLQLLLRVDWRIIHRSVDLAQLRSPSLARLLLEQRARESCVGITPQLPITSPPGRWWFQVLTISNAALSYPDKQRWAPGAFPSRPVQAAAGRQWANIAELLDEGFEERPADEPADEDVPVARRSRGLICLRLLLLPTRPDSRVEIVAYEHSPIPALRPLVDAFCRMSKAEHAVVAGDYGKILIDGPLKIFFTAMTLVQADNIRAVAVTCKSLKKEEQENSAEEASTNGNTTQAPSLALATSGWEDAIPATTATTASLETAIEAQSGDEDVLDGLVGDGESSGPDSPTTRSPFFAAMKKLWGK